MTSTETGNLKPGGEHGAGTAIAAEDTLHYMRTYEIKDVYVPTQKLDEVKSFLNQIAADERSNAVLRRAN